MVCRVYSRSDAPLKRARDERFARLAAEVEGITLLDAWCRSVSPPAPPTPGRRVSASKAGKRCAERIAFLKRLRAQKALNEETEPFTLERLASLMEDATRTLMEAANVAQRAGASSIAQSLRKAVVTHAGRAHRVERQTANVQIQKKTVPVSEYLERLRLCECGR